MDDRSAVRCMRHCSSDFNVFYVEFPEYCPVCRSKLKGSFLNVPPFLLPHPFVSSSREPYSVVVKPTDGCFLNTYQSGQDLHIGITSSTGLVYNYDEGGIHIDKDTSWALCVALKLSDILNSRRESWDSMIQNWDKKLNDHCQNPEWNPEKYNPSSHNCYNFVLSFLETILPERHIFQSKETFCRDYIVPLTTRAAQYIDLHRKILSEGTQIRKANVT